MSMKQVKVEKVTLNIGTGGPGDVLDKAQKLLDKLTNHKSVTTKSKRRIPTWNIRPGLEIGCKVTLRGNDAEEFFKRALVAVDNKLKSYIFDTQGNFSFGIKEHIHLPGVRYDPDLGIFGMDVCVTLERKGFRVLRKRNPSKISESHRIKPEEAIEWIKNKFNVNIIE